MAVIAAPATAEVTTIAQGGTVFVGEEGLTFIDNVGAPIPAVTVFEWYRSNNIPGTSSPSATYITKGAGNEVIDLKTFREHTGNWYIVNRTVSPAVATPAINVMWPSIDIKTFNSATGEDITHKRYITNKSYLTFRLDSNLYSGIQSRPNYVPGDVTGIDIVVIDKEGTIYTELYNDETTLTSTHLTNLVPNISQYYLPGNSCVPTTLTPNWALGNREYKTGIYSYHAQANLNGIKDNLGIITRTTKSYDSTIEVVNDLVEIEANRYKVSQNSNFSVTITGCPYEYYVLWVKRSNRITAPYTAPYIKPNQDNVSLAGSTEGDNAAIYQFSEGQTVQDDVCQNPPATGGYYAMVRLPDSGNRTIDFRTDESTKYNDYTIQTDHFTGDVLADPPVAVIATNPTTDTAHVSLTEGFVTISREGNPNTDYEIVLSGLNTDSNTTWLFISGTNLPQQGSSIENLSDGVNSAENANGIPVSPFYPNGYLDTGSPWEGIHVATDDTWEYRWNISNVYLDFGGWHEDYSIYAVSTATSEEDLRANDATYESVGIYIDNPIWIEHISPYPATRGDDISITGFIRYNIPKNLGIWIFGDNTVHFINETVEENGTFKYVLTSTEILPAGRFTIIGQHPMYNSEIDLVPQADNPAKGQTAVVRPIKDAHLTDPVTGLLPPVFLIEGPGSLRGSDAVIALCNAMGSLEVDDIYSTTSFTVEEPVAWFGAIGNKYAGDTFTITGTTNVASGHIIRINATPLGGTSPTLSGTTIVDSDYIAGRNTWKFNVNTSTWIPGGYMITVESSKGILMATQIFNVLTTDQTQSLKFSLSPGWNLISTPVNKPILTLNGSICETAYAYNTTTGTYEEFAITEMVPGEGYWIGAFTDSQIEYYGKPLTSYQKTLSTGWNLIGGLGIATETTSINVTPDALSGPLYQYNQDAYAYSRASILKPGQGYWASTAAPCTINVSICPPEAPG